MKRVIIDLLLEDKLYQTNDIDDTSNFLIDLKASSSELEFDGVVIKYGCSSQMKLVNYTFPEHVFYMHIGDYQVDWKVSNNTEIKKIKPQSNDIWFIPADTLVSQFTNDTHEFLAVRLQADKMIESAKNIVNKNIVLKPIYNIKDPHLEHIFKLMLSEVQTSNKNGKYFIDSLVSLLSIHFINNYCLKDTDLVENINGITKENYDRIINYINTHLSDQLNLGQLAAELEIDKYDLIKKFKNSMDVTPYQFIIQKKLEHSKYLLRNKAYSISDIANMLNFSDQAHFTNSFKKIFGLTPNKYRQSIT